MSKSGTLTYQMMYELRDIGFSSAVGIGGDPIIGTTHIDALQAFSRPGHRRDRDDRRNRRRRRGASSEFISDNVDKPVVGYVAGFTAPEGKTMGHAGAIVSGSSGTAAAKKEALEAAGVKVGKTPSETAQLMRDVMTELAANAGSWPPYSVDLSGALSGANGDRAPFIVAQIQLALGAQEGVDHLRTGGHCARDISESHCSLLRDRDRPAFNLLSPGTRA